MTSDTLALSVRDLRVTRARRLVLEIDSLDVAHGEVVALLGPNGAGKSTLLLAAATLLPSSGRLELLGEAPSMRNRVHLRRQTATVFQDAALLDMSARANVETALALRRVPRGERRAIADRWLERLAVSHRADARVHQLSGGEAQRVSLARAFAVRPRLMFLDEPFAALDATTRSALIGDVRALLAAEGITALLTTHDRAEAELLADRVVIVLDGRIAQQGEASTVLARPQNEAVARFLGFSIVPGAFAARLIGLSQPPAAQAAVPPQAVRIADPGIEAVVTAVRGAPGGAELVLDAGAPLALWAPVADLHEHSLKEGSRISVSVDAERVAWI